MTAPFVLRVAEGILATGYLVAALFFPRFWRETGDRLFAFLAASFTLQLCSVRCSRSWEHG